ncbi:MAG TPA: hypothetical protein VNS52_12905 [Gemmatimonadaceae bacterium]|nr:hypothetical protein [Gemmatimonadaceae bacterium]
MDLGILAAIAMLVVWAVATFVYEAPGWIHLLLSVGLFVLMWRIVVRGARRNVPKGSGGEAPRDRPTRR